MKELYNEIEKATNRQAELEKLAEGRCLGRMGFTIEEWLNEQEYKEYLKSVEVAEGNNLCPVCWSNRETDICSDCSYEFQTSLKT